jgi:hypothetical protein
VLACGSAFLWVGLRNRDRGELAIAVIHSGFLLMLGALALVSFVFEGPRRYMAWSIAGLLGGDLIVRILYVRFFGRRRDT